MSRAQEQFRKLNERLSGNAEWPTKVTPLIVIGEIIWIVIIFALIVAGLLTGLLAFAFLVGGLILPLILIRKLKKKLDQTPPPASEQIIDHDEIKTDDRGSPFV